MKKIKFKNFVASNKNPFFLIAGPCVIESRKHTIKIAKLIDNICKELKINFIFKSSFDKANRSSINSYRGYGIEAGLEILGEVKDLFKCEIITDVHNEKQCHLISKHDIVDVIQIPAFLSRQTDLLHAAGETNKIINIKKGQFLAPWDMKNIVKKITDVGYNDIIMLNRKR